VRRNISLLVLATTSAVVIGLLIPLSILIRQLAMDRAIANADQDARAIAVAAAVVSDTTELRRLVDETNKRSKRIVSVTLPNNTTIGPVPPQTDAFEAARQGAAGHSRYGGGEEVFVSVRTPGGRAVGRSYVPHDLLFHGVGAAWVALLVLALLILGMCAAAADRMARWFVRPINRLIEVADQISGGDLEARAPVDGPRETARLAFSFNRLAERIGELIAAERELVADLSHRLRTPITALRLDAEAIPGTVDPARLAAHVVTLERTVDEIIMTARRPLTHAGGARGDLAAVVRGRLAWWSVLAEEQNRRVGAQLSDETVWVRSMPADLNAAVDALFENVFSHTKEGAGFDVLVQRRPGGGGLLVVADEGPGLASDELDTRGMSTRGSTGLGLDIVRRTAEASGGRLRIGNRLGGGAAITVELGPPAAEPG
jgi:signal transduction histidine kinase